MDPTALPGIASILVTNCEDYLEGYRVLDDYQMPYLTNDQIGQGFIHVISKFN